MIRRLIVVLLLAASLQAQERKALTIPIERKAGLILVSAKVQGIDGTFILDTGAQWTTVSPELARSATERRAAGVYGTAGVTPAEIGRVMLTIGGHNFSNTVVITSTAVVSKEIGRKIDGMIGMDLLGQFKQISVDLSGNVLTLSH